MTQIKMPAGKAGKVETYNNQNNSISHDVLLAPLKPMPLKVNFNNIPLSLRDKCIFVMWRYVLKNGKWTKPLYQVNGHYAKTNDQNTWASYDNVKTAYEKGGFDGIGIVLTGEVVGIDLDHVISDFEIEPWAQEIITQFKDTYIELSPGGDGLHILTTGISRFTGKRHESKRLEVYDHSSPRYFTITGQLYDAGHTELTNTQDELDWLASKYDVKSDAPLLEYQPQIESRQDADSIMQAILNSKSKDKFNALNSGNITNDHSADDLAFCNLIAYFTTDKTIIDSIFRKSPFRMRGKWDEKHSADGKTYAEMTINKAITGNSAQAGTGSRAQYGDVSNYFNAGEVTPSPINFKLVSSTELTSKQKHTEWLVKGLIGSDNMGLVFGQSGHGKSFFVLDMAFCIATGIDFFGHKVTQGSVVYIAGEGHTGLTKRLRALEIKYNTQAPKLFLSETSAALIDAGSVRDVRAAIDAICSDASLVIVDTLHRNFGAGDENSATDFGAFCNNVDSHIRKNGESVLIVHHSGHMDADRSRGSSSIKAAMDFEYKVTKSSHFITVSNTKMKDDEPPEAMRFEATEQAIGWFDEDGKEFTSLILNSTNEQSNLKKSLTAAEKTAMDSLRNAARETFTDKGVHLNDWRTKFYELSTADSSDTKRKAFNRVRTSLVVNGHLSVSDDFYDFAGVYATESSLYRFAVTA